MWLRGTSLGGKQAEDGCKLSPPAVVQRYFDSEEDDDDEYDPDVERLVHAIRCLNDDHGSVPFDESANCDVSGFASTNGAPPASCRGRTRPFATRDAGEERAPSLRRGFRPWFETSRPPTVRDWRCQPGAFRRRSRYSFRRPLSQPSKRFVSAERRGRCSDAFGVRSPRRMRQRDRIPQRDSEPPRRRGSPLGKINCLPARSPKINRLRRTVSPSSYRCREFHMEQQMARGTRSTHDAAVSSSSNGERRGLRHVQWERETHGSRRRDVDDVDQDEWRTCRWNAENSRAAPRKRNETRCRWPSPGVGNCDRESVESEMHRCGIEEYTWCV